MQPMHHNPAAEGIGSQVVANGVRGLAGGTTASGVVTALAPAGADEVSVQAALAFAAEGAQTMVTNSLAQEELARTGAAYIEAAGDYMATDAAISTTLL